MNEGLTPETFALASEPTPIVVEQEAALETADRNLADLAEHPGWRALQEDWTARITDYRTLSGYDIGSMSKEEIGEVWLLGKHVADEMQKELDRVKAAYDRFDAR